MTIPVSTQVQQYTDNYLIMADVKQHRVAFVVHEISGEGEAADGSRVTYLVTGDGAGTEKTEDAEVFLEGFIKWDGCSHWNFHDNDCMTHICGRRNAVAFGKLFIDMFDIAKKALGDRLGEPEGRGL